MPALATAPPKQHLGPRCPDPECRKPWQGIRSIGGFGVFLFQHRCEGCRRWWSLFYRVTRDVSVRRHLLDIVRTFGRDEGSMRETIYRAQGLTDTERAMLFEVARLQDVA